MAGQTPEPSFQPNDQDPSMTQGRPAWQQPPPAAYTPPGGSSTQAGWGTPDQAWGTTPGQAWAAPGQAGAPGQAYGGQAGAPGQAYGGQPGPGYPPPPGPGRTGETAYPGGEQAYPAGDQVYPAGGQAYAARGQEQAYSAQDQPYAAGGPGAAASAGPGAGNGAGPDYQAYQGYQAGYGQPGQDPGQSGGTPQWQGIAGLKPAAEPRPRGEKGFVGSLFDFSFSSFVTPKIVKVLYALLTVWTVLVALILAVVGFRTGGLSGGLFTLIIIDPIVVLLTLGIWRVVLEAFMVVFRIYEETTKLAERAGRTD